MPKSFIGIEIIRWVSSKNKTLIIHIYALRIIFGYAGNCVRPCIHITRRCVLYRGPKGVESSIGHTGVCSVHLLKLFKRIAKTSQYSVRYEGGRETLAVNKWGFRYHYAADYSCGVEYEELSFLGHQIAFDI